jgi:hypothetical protein
MRNKLWFLLFVTAVLSVVVFSVGADTITKGLIGKEDIYMGTDNVPAQTFSRATSTGSTITLTRLNGSQIPWDNSYTRTIRPLNITGDGSGTISGYILSIVDFVASGTASITGETTLTGALTGTTGTFSGAFVSDSLTTGAITTTGVTNSGTSTANIGAFLKVTIDGKVFDTGAAAPTSGTYAVGDRVYSTVAAIPTVIADTPIYWYCSVAGTPGTWIAIYPPFRATPASATAFGKPGMIAIDNSYIYTVPAADNAWKRSAQAAW